MARVRSGGRERVVASAEEAKAGKFDNGNETAAGSRTFTYDVANRLASTSSGGSTTTYSYDGDGNRATAVAGGSTTRYLWDFSHGLPQLALERDGGGSLIRRYLYGDRRTSVTGGGNTFYYHYDKVGSTANLTSGSGATQWTYAYEPFGTIRTETQDDPGAPQNPMKFAGEQLDPTELYNLRAREYDPALGRFLHVDPARPAPDTPYLSAYVYADDKPTVMVDPAGLQAKASSAGVQAVALPSSPAVHPVPPSVGRPTLVFPFPIGYPKRLVQGLHPTDGLPVGDIPAHPALDIGAPAYSPVLAVASGSITWRQGGTDPADEPTCGRGYGRDFYLRADTTRISYYYAHLHTRRVQKGEHVRVGEVVGTLANWHQWRRCQIDDHLHLGASGSREHIFDVYRAPQVNAS